MKICVLGCGLRTPLLLHGLVNAGLASEKVALYDTDPGHARLMSRLGEQLAEGTGIRIVRGSPWKKPSRTPPL